MGGTFRRRLNSPKNGWHFPTTLVALSDDAGGTFRRVALSDGWHFPTLREKWVALSDPTLSDPKNGWHFPTLSDRSRRRFPTVIYEKWVALSDAFRRRFPTTRTGQDGSAPAFEVPPARVPYGLGPASLPNRVPSAVRTRPQRTGCGRDSKPNRTNDSSVAKKARAKTETGANLRFASSSGPQPADAFRR